MSSNTESTGARARWAGLKPWQQVMLVVLAGVVGLALLVGLRRTPEEVVPPRQIPTVTTIAARTRTGAIQVRGSGTVRPSAEVTISPQVGGRIAWVSSAFVSGGRFAAGQALLRVEPADYENSVQAAQADVAQRQVDVLTAEEEVAIARDEYERLARREGLDPNPDSAGALVLREPQLQAARAALQRAAAGLEDARLSLDRTWIRAPFNGIVRQESVDLGQFVSPGQVLGQMYATDAVEIVVPLSDDESALIPGLWDVRAGAEGERIPVAVTSEYGGVRYEWTGYVDRAEAALDEQTRTVNVAVRVPGAFRPSETRPDRPPLLIGSYASVDIEGATYDRYAVVPSDALRDGGVVWTVASDTLLRMTPVQVIQEVEEEAYVLGDLRDGDPIIVSFLPYVTEGMTVRLAEPLETAPSTGAADPPVSTDAADPPATPEAPAASPDGGTPTPGAAARDEDGAS